MCTAFSNGNESPLNACVSPATQTSLSARGLGPVYHFHVPRRPFSRERGGRSILATVTLSSAFPSSWSQIFLFLSLEPKESYLSESEPPGLTSSQERSFSQPVLRLRSLCFSTRCLRLSVNLRPVLFVALPFLDCGTGFRRRLQRALHREFVLRACLPNGASKLVVVFRLAVTVYRSTCACSPWHSTALSLLPFPPTFSWHPRSLYFCSLGPSEDCRGIPQGALDCRVR